jgi:hypothetical protein
MEKCVFNLENISVRKCRADYGSIVAVFLDESNEEISKANSVLEATWKAKINGEKGENRLYIPINTKKLQVERTLNDPTMVTTNSGYHIKTTDGERAYKFDLAGLTIDQHNLFKSLDYQEMYAWFVTASGAILCIGTETGVKPIPVQTFVAEFDAGEGIEDMSHSTLDVHISIRSDYFTSAIVPTAFNPLQLSGIVDFEVEILSSDSVADEVIFTATAYPDGYEIVRFNSPTNAADDFYIEDEDGNIEEGVTLTNIGNRYTLGVVMDADTTYTLKRKTADLATDKGYELRTPVEFTTPVVIP